MKKANIEDLRPTQMTQGAREIAKKGNREVAKKGDREVAKKAEAYRSLEGGGHNARGP